MNFKIKKLIALLCVFCVLFTSMFQLAMPAVVKAAEGNTHSGTWAMKADFNNTWQKVKSNDFTVEPNTDYTLTMYTKGSGNLYVYLLSNWVEVALTPYQIQNQDSTVWEKKEIKFNSGTDPSKVESTENFQLCVMFGDSSGSGNIMYIDDVSIKKDGDNTNLVVNGDFEAGNGTWWFQTHANFKFSIMEPPAFNNSAISPASAEFNKSEPSDISVVITANGNTLDAVKNGDSTLVQGTDYTTGGAITIKKEYLATLPEGTAELTFDFSNGADPVLTVNIINVVITEGILDGFENLNKIFAYGEGDEGKFSCTNDGADAFEGDAYRLLPKRDEDRSLIYKLDNDINTFYALTYNWVNVADMDPIVSVSEDGINYEEVELVKSQLAVIGTYNDWAKIVYYNYDIINSLKTSNPETAIDHPRYLKFTVPKMDDADIANGDSRYSWAYQYSKLTINRSLQPVTADPAGGIITETTQVTLSNPTEGAGIYYFTQDDPTEKLYTGPISLSTYTELTVYAKKPGMEESFKRTYIFYSEEEQVIDRYGQKKSVDFDKVTDDQELVDDVAADEVYYNSLETATGRDQYGGMEGSKELYGLQETGFFHIEKVAFDGVNEKFVMVDPLGNLYFSLGVNCTGSAGETYTQVQGREYMFEWIPSNTGEYAAAFLNGNSAYYSPYVANLIKKYGSFDQVEYYTRMVERLKKMGFTSEGGFADTPSVGANTTGFPEVKFSYLPDNYKIGSTTLFDVYKEGAREAIVAMLEENKIAARKNDPKILGYLFGNELPYNRFGTTVLSLKASESATKSALVDILQTKYIDISAFNTAWATNFASFEEMGEAAVILNTDSAVNDMNEFFEVYLDKFYEMLSTEFRKVDPNHMIMGDRYLVTVADNSTLRKSLSKVAGKYIDVISYNYYTYDINLDRLKEMTELANKPVMITEFHFGEPSQGLGGGIRGVSSEEEKGLYYRYYVEKLAASGYAVGAHWFEMMDQAATGRWFEGLTGEAYGIGLFNVADRPYKTFIGSVMETNNNIYDLISGEDPYFVNPDVPVAEPAKETSIKKASAEIIIDGIKDEAYPTGLTINLDQNDRALGTANGEAAQIDLAWDETNLYVYAHIDDVTPMMNPKTGFDIWNGDGLEMFIAAEAAGIPGQMRPKDTQLIINGQTGETHAYRNGSSAPLQPTASVITVKDEDALGYVIEAAIPLADLFISNPEAGRKIGFDIGFDNGNGENRTAQYLWSGIDGNASARDLWGTVTLIDGSEEPQSGNADLSGISISSGNISPAFNSGIVSYTASVANSVSSIDITATKADTNAIMAINGTAQTSGVAKAISLNVGENTVSIAVTAQNGTLKTYILKITRAAASDGPSNPDPNFNPVSNSEKPVLSNDGSVSIKITPVYDNKTKTASYQIDQSMLNTMVDMAKEDEAGVKTISFDMQKSSGADTYLQQFPAGILTSSASNLILEINTPLGKVAVPSNMLASQVTSDSASIGLSIGVSDTSKNAIELKVTVDGKQLEWNNPNAPAVISIPYKPSSAELKNSDFLTIYYIDENGNKVPVPNSEYDAKSEQLIFTTTNSGTYAILYNKRTFQDAGKVSWAQNAIEVVASKGILNGTTDAEFSPEQNITRGDFLSGLIKALGLTTDVDTNFSDIDASDINYKYIGIAKALGITSGVGNNKFSHDAEISRQDMMVLAKKALDIAKKLQNTGEESDLQKFDDKDKISGYAIDSIATLVNEGIISGDGKNVNPKGSLTRAEASAVLYKIFKK